MQFSAPTAFLSSVARARTWGGTAHFFLEIIELNFGKKMPHIANFGCFIISKNIMWLTAFFSALGSSERAPGLLCTQLLQS